MKLWPWIIALWLSVGMTLRAADAAPTTSPNAIATEGGYLVERINPKTEDLRLFWADDQGNVLHDFIALEKYAAAHGEKLLFAANAGMFQPDSKPVGLLVQDGNEVDPLNLADGPGNFYMKPNGVFLINEKHEAMVVESSSYAALLTPVVWATQSGPLLVNQGIISPDFRSDSANRKIRSGVGVRKDGTDRAGALDPAGEFLRVRARVQEPLEVRERSLPRRRNLGLPRAGRPGNAGPASFRPHAGLGRAGDKTVRRR